LEAGGEEMGNGERADDPGPLFSRYGGPILICIVCLVIYSNTFYSPFVFDDLSYIKDNPALISLSNLWPPTGTRYLGYLSFALNYRVAGPGVLGFHIVNLAIHALNAILVYYIVGLTFKTPWMDRGRAARNAGASAAIALTASLLFAAHPIQTQAVTYLSQRFASLATLFYLLTIFIFIKWRLSKERGRAGRWLYLLAFGTAILAQMTKEIAFTLPFIIILYEFIFFGDTLALKRRIAHLGPFLLTTVIIPAMLFLPVKAFDMAGQGISKSMKALQLHELSTLSRYDYLITQLRVIVTYLRLLVLPINQNFEYDYPIYSSILDPAPLISLIFLSCLLALGLYALYKSGLKANPYARLGAFGVFWFFITLSIESSVIPIQHVIFEHRLYLPSVGAAMVAGALIYHLFERLKRSGAQTGLPLFTAVVLILTVVPLGQAAYRRNALWKDPVKLYKDVIRKSPNRVPAHTFLGEAYLERGETYKAIEEFNTSIRLKPDDWVARHSLGNAYVDLGKIDRAITEFRAVLKINPAHVKSLNNLGSAYYLKGLLEASLTQYIKALRYRPGHPEAHYNLSLVYKDLGRPERAAFHYQKYLEVSGKR
jgi:tetratricopeptide (TPR) repeat protein